MTLSNYDHNESSDYEFGELALSNCDSNENADEELGEMTLSDYNSDEDAEDVPIVPLEESVQASLALPQVTSVLDNVGLTEPGPGEQ